MPNDYFPDTDNGIASWTKQLVAKLAPDPQALGVPQDLFDSYASLVADFADALRQTVNRNTCTRVQILLKNQLKKQVETSSREVGRLILAQPVLSLQVRVELGFGDPEMRVRTTGIPETAPRLSITPTDDKTLQVRLQSVVSFQRSRPPGVSGALIFWRVAERMGVSHEEWRFYDVTRKTRLRVEIPRDVPAGSLVELRACWINSRFERGPMSPPVSMHVFESARIGDRLKQAA